jgi:iron complex outermembrane recepter protein
MRNQLLFFFSILFFGFGQANAQETTVRFKIINQKNEPLPFTTVVIVSVPDTIHKQTKITDSAGLVSFQLLQSRPYLVRVSSATYQTMERKITITTDNPLFSFTLQPSVSTLKNVIVTTTRPLIRQEDDKTIVDPEPIAAASTNAYEILEKTPGIFVDQDGNIYLSSMSPARISINGREMKMSAADIATMLKNLPPNAISKIEIIRTPSAKYDASGNGGIVNIVLRKGVKLGLTGSVVAGMQQGDYGNQLAGLNLNNNTGKKSSYLNLNYSRRNSFERIKTDRLFAVDSVLQQDAGTKYPATNYFTSYGISDSLGAKWFVDFAGSFTYQTFDNSTANKNLIKKISTNEIISNSLNNVDYNGKYLRISNGITFTRKIDSVSEWSNDFYYSYDRNRNNQQYYTNFYSPVIFTTSGFGSPDNDRNNFTFTSDLRKKLHHRLTIETGVKTSLLF